MMYRDTDMKFWNLLLAITVGQHVFVVEGFDHHCSSLASSGHCTKCHFGWYGAYCDKACQNCDLGGCNKETGVCLQCQAGYHSTNCSLTCPPQCRESYDHRVFCNRTTGNCLEGCKQTWWGDKCEHKCGKECRNSICFFYDGSCAFGCKDGLTGNYCNQSCSTGCLGDRCDELRGDKPTCTRGCIPGWKPPFCVTPCPPNCLSCTEAGVCTSCKKGFTGTRCKRRCNCGSGCSDDKICDGCTDGWWGETCDLPCSENCTRCQQESGICTACLQGFEYDGKNQCITVMHVAASVPPIPEDFKVPIVITAVIIVLIIVAVSIVIYIRRRRRHLATCWGKWMDNGETSSCGLLE